MKKIYYLSTCSTCTRILKEFNIENGIELQDIKKDKITKEQLEQMAAMAGGYEPLFSRRSQQYKARNLKDVKLSEEDYKNLILEEYTFLKRPVMIFGKDIFIGNQSDTIEMAKKAAKKF